MNLQALRDLLEKIPLLPVLGLYLGYLGYDYYNFVNDAGSTLNRKKQQVATAQTEIDGLHSKIKKMNDFSQTLNLKKAELRSLAQELESTKASLPETLDIPDLMKTLLIEAKRAGLTVTSLKPGASKVADYYGEQILEFESTGIYFQFLAFLDRIANLQKIIRIENIKFTPVSASNAKYVQLKSTIDFKAYRYIGSKADELGKGGASSGAPASKNPTRKGT